MKRTHKAPSDIHGNGLFASSRISIGETVCPVVEIERDDEGEVLAADITAEGKLINHSSNGNVRLRRSIRGYEAVAIRTIEEGEEITSDYDKAVADGAPVEGSKPGYKQASVVPSIPTTGPEAIYHRLASIDLDAKEKEQMDLIKSGKKTKRGDAVKILNLIHGLRRNEKRPESLMITRVPIIPAQHRPFSVMGNTFVSGDANELYRDLFKVRDAHAETEEVLGRAGAGDSLLDMYDAVKALYGYGDPTEPKTAQRGVSGFLKQVTGTNPKFGWLNRKMISKTQDLVARGAITIGADLGLDEISIPEDMAWKVYAPFVQRRLAMNGVGPSDALKAVKDRNEQALKALEKEMEARPIIYSRAPVWFKFGTLAAKPKMHKGDNITINSMVTTGLNADFDGDDNLNQIYACIADEDLQIYEMQFKSIQNHRIKFAEGSCIPSVSNAGIYLFDLEDFPKGELVRTVDTPKGKIDVHATVAPIKVLAYDKSSGALKWADVAMWSKHYDREIEIVETHNNYQIVTDDDPRAVLGVNYETLECRTFSPSDALERKVLVPRAKTIPSFEETVHSIPGENGFAHNATRMVDTVELTADIGWLIGAMAGDGWVCKHHGVPVRFDFADNDGYNIAKLKQVVEALCAGRLPACNRVQQDISDDGRYGSTCSYRFPSSNIACWLKSLIGGDRDENTSGSANKHLPVFYLSTSKEFRSGLLSGLLDTDGSISVSTGKSKPQLMCNFSSTSIRMVQEVKLLAASLGISSRITPFSTPLGKPAWMLTFSSPELQKWGCPYMAHKVKLDKFNSVPKIEQSAVMAKYDIVPISYELADNIAKFIGCPKIKKADRIDASDETEKKKQTQSLYMSFAQARNATHEKAGAVSRSTALEAVRVVGIDVIMGLKDGDRWLAIVNEVDVTWERVTSVQKTGIKETGYDLTVPGYETFMSVDGIILSNTINIHVPASDEAVKDAHEKLMASKQLFSTKNFEAVMPQPKHEQILGLYTAKNRPAKNKYRFATEAQALSAIKSGKVSLSDEVEIG